MCCYCAGSEKGNETMHIRDHLIHKFEVLASSLLTHFIFYLCECLFVSSLLRATFLSWFISFELFHHVYLINGFVVVSILSFVVSM